MKQLSILSLFVLFNQFDAHCDLYDRNKYDLDFRRQDQPESSPRPGQRQCPCDPGDPECPCEIDSQGNYHRVD